MQKNVLISIKPKYVSEIIKGNKKVEYRKGIFKKSVNKVYIYSSSPEKRIIGYFEYGGYLVGTPSETWEKTNSIGGIDKKEYFEYFKDKKEAYAIKIDKLFIFQEKINPQDIFENFIPPQSYKYLDKDIHNV